MYLACAAAVVYISVRTEKNDDAEDVELGHLSSTSINEASTSTTSSVNKASKRSLSTPVAADSLV